MTDPISRYQQTRCHRRGWVFERTGWAAMAIVAAAAATGVFGDGALSRVAAVGADGLAVNYPRFGRARVPLELEAEWSPSSTEAVLWLERDYVADFTIEEILPPPASVTLDAERVYYTFMTAQSDEPITVEFQLRPKRGGRIAGSLGLGAEPALTLRQFLFP